MSDDALTDALSSLVGARIDGAFANPATGLIALSVYAGARRVLGVGIGPVVQSIGWLPDAPRARAEASHPLVAAMRAHLVDHRVRRVSVDDEGTVWIAAGGADAIARIALRPGRHGAVTVLGADGQKVVRVDRSRTETADAWTRPGSLDGSGAAMLAASEDFARTHAWSQLARAVSKRTVALEKRVEAVTRDLARLDDVGQLQKIGRMLLAQGDRVPRGVARATLDDYEEGGTIEVALSPAQPAKAQATGFFARARRLQRGATVMKQRLDEAIAQARALRELGAEIEHGVADATVAIAPFVARARATGVRIERAPASAPTRREVPAREPFHRFRGVRNAVILVGRGGKDNDTLTTRHARPHDLWLHVRGVPGAHVVVPLTKGSSCPADLLVDAATLAAHFSDARGADLCEVTYVERRHVRKPRGAPAGAVVHDREKVLALRLEPDRLARLLATRDA